MILVVCTELAHPRLQLAELGSIEIIKGKNA